MGPDGSGSWYVLQNTGNGFQDAGCWISNINYINLPLDGLHAMPADLNGDGKMDMLLGPASDGSWYALISFGYGFRAQSFGSGYGDFDVNRVRGLDVNGDGLTDIVLGPDSSGNVYAMESTGSWGPSGFTSGFVDKACGELGGQLDGIANNGNIRVMDVDGDGRQDLVVGPDGSGTWWTSQGIQQAPDLLVRVRNGYGGSSTVQYQPSTRFPNRQLPFPLQVATSVTTDDGNGTQATTQYSYAGGYFHPGEKDFRGFASTTMTGPPWPGGAKTQTTTYFHQGNDVAIGVNNPAVATAFMKGKQYRVIAGDTVSSVYWITETTYRAPDAGLAYFYDPPVDVFRSFCASPGTCGRQTHTRLHYDSYGNVDREDRYGDTSDASDDRTVIRVFARIRPRGSWDRSAGDDVHGHRRVQSSFVEPDRADRDPL